VPLATTLLYLLGVARTFKEREHRPLGSLFLLCALTPMLALAVGESMVYDNDRLFMPSFPFLAALAGIGFAWLSKYVLTSLQKWARPCLSKTALPLLAIAVYVPPILSAARLYPHLLSYYSAAVGGLPGAARQGLETTYWCETYARALPYLNDHTRPGDVVWVEDWSHEVLFYYQLHGQLDRDLRIAWPEYGHTIFHRQSIQGVRADIDEADHVLIQYRQTGHTAEVRRWLRGRSPAYRLSHRDIPLMEIYTP
jgi:hypothetical protein